MSLNVYEERWGKNKIFNPTARAKAPKFPKITNNAALFSWQTTKNHFHFHIKKVLFFSPNIFSSLKTTSEKRNKDVKQQKLLWQLKLFFDAYTFICLTAANITVFIPLYILLFLIKSLWTWVILVTFMNYAFSVPRFILFIERASSGKCFYRGAQPMQNAAKWILSVNDYSSICICSCSICQWTFHLTRFRYETAWWFDFDTYTRRTRTTFVKCEWKWSKRHDICHTNIFREKCVCFPLWNPSGPMDETLLSKSHTYVFDLYLRIYIK